MSALSVTGIGWYGEPFQHGFDTPGPARRNPVFELRVRHVHDLGQLVEYGAAVVTLAQQLDSVDGDDEGGLVTRQRPAHVVEDLTARCGGDDVAGGQVRGSLRVRVTGEHLEVPQPPDERCEQRDHQHAEDEQAQP